MHELPQLLKMYTTLFNAVTDAILKMDRMDFGSAKEILISAQSQTEELYINEEEMR